MQLTIESGDGMYMNKFIIGAVMGSFVGALGAWYCFSSKKDKKTVLKYMKKWGV
ncbi:MAG: hypothetical protein ACRCSG_07165 [Cellulosilyticaceae bacterium]